MVTVSDYAVRENSDGEEFIALILQGDLTMVKSQETGRYYATAKKCSITSTFTADQAQALIGRQIPGSIIRQESDPYDYTIPETGEVVELTHRWVYSPDEFSAAVPQPVLPKPSTNGTLVTI